MSDGGYFSTGGDVEILGLNRSTPTTAERRGTYVASRASIPKHPAMWRRLRDEEGYVITSSWIDEAGPGESANLTDLWQRVEREIRSSERLILYVEPDDFPLKGALVEVGIAIGCGVPVTIVAPGVAINATSFRPIGSWMCHPLVTLAGTLEAALDGAAKRDRA